ncbi:hypothetical protein [Streptomyces sp. NPDC005548]
MATLSAEALQAIDQGNAKSTATELTALRQTTRAYRVDYLRQRDDPAS